MIHKNIKALGWVSFFTDMASAMITPILPIFIVLILHEDAQTLGYVLSITTFVSYGFRFLFGYFSDKYQKTKIFLVIGYGISAITKPLLSITSSWQGVSLLRGTERLGKAVRSASRDKLISQFSEKNTQGKTFGFHKMMDIAGELTGAFLVFCILYFFGKNEEVFKNIFTLTIIPGFISVCILIFFTTDSAQKREKKEFLWEQSDTQFFPIIGIYLSFLFFIIADSFFLLQAENSGFPIYFLPLLIMVSTGTQTLSSLWIGKKIDKLGGDVILFWSFISGILGTVSLLFSQFVFAFIFLGLYSVASTTALRTLISQQAKNKASVYGILYAGIAFSTGLGALFVGYIWTHFGSDFTIKISLLGCVFSLLIFLVFLEKKQNKEKQES